MTTVTYDERSFMVDGNRIWLVSGSVHYFRTPSALWRDRLLKAKRAGLNCICTYVAWNLHEPEEGQWDFSGDRDLVEFVRTAEDLGLYVILRPGPYICAGWDFGGFPAWLTTKSGVSYRTNNAAYTHYYDKFFANVLPRLADLQVSHGGNIIAIQNENEYVMTTMPDRMAYLEFVSQLFRRSGFDVPILNCNIFSDPPLPDSVECVNSWDQAIQDLKRMRLSRPDAPLLMTEFRCGCHDIWGGEHQTRGARETARRTLEVIGCGAQYNYYMWHGGTNFGFYGGRGFDDDAAYMTTSHDYDAPLAEGGGLTEKYTLTRLVNVLAETMGRFFASCRAQSPGVSIHDATDVMNLSGPDGRWAIITNHGYDEIENVSVSLADGTEMTVSLQPLGATAIPVNLRIDSAHTLDYANVMPFGLFGPGTLVLHGPSGFEARLSVNDCEIRCEIPAGEEPKVIEHQEMRIVLVKTDLAKRTWFVEDTLVFGPPFAGETLDDISPLPRGKQYALLPMDGQIRHRKYPSPAQKHAPPRLGAWKRIAVCTEPVSDDLEWEKIDRPRDVDRLGAHYGYLWYRIDINEDRPKKRQLFLPGCEDRATIYLNGQLLGVWGRGSDAQRSVIPAPFKKGANVLTLLADNMGRFDSGSRLGELKGLFDHIYDAKPLRTLKFKLKRSDNFSRRVIPRGLVHLVEKLETMPKWEATVDIPLRKILPIHLSFRELPAHVAVVCNDRACGFFQAHGSNFGDVMLGSELKQGKNRLKLLLWGKVTAKDLAKIQLHVLSEPVSAGAKWRIRKWELPEEGGPVVGKDRPAWYATHFKYTPSDRPLFMHIVGAKKGQIFLNGHDLGRFWNIGPQQFWYLPECWLTAQNELLIFEEQGNIPRRSRLEFRPKGPYH